MVPDVTDTFRAHPPQENLPSAIRQPCDQPHSGHTNPFGHRNPSRNSTHDESSGNHSRNAAHVPG
jgi:hypothetical protein